MNSEGVVERPSQISLLGKLVEEGTVKKPEKFFPEVSHKAVAYWLLGSAANVYGIVVFGGLTRLTESGYGLYASVPLMPSTDFTKFKYHRMETRDWYSTTHQRC